MPKAPKLTAKQEAFVREYLISNNGLDAARKAGYKGNDNTLAVVAAENINKPNVKAVIDAGKQQIAKVAEDKYAISRDRNLRELAIIAYGSMADLFEWDHEMAQFIPKKDLTPEQMKFIDGITAEETWKEVPNPNFGEENDFNGKIDERETIWKQVKKFKITTLARERINAIKEINIMCGFDQPDGTQKETKLREQLRDAFTALQLEEQDGSD